MAKKVISAFGFCCILIGGLSIAGLSALPESLPVGVSPRGLALGVPFQNGKVGLVVANCGAPTFIGQATGPAQLDPSNSTLQIFTSSPTGLRLEATLPTALSPRGVELFDLDGNGTQEILVTAYEGGVLQVFSHQQGNFVKVEEVDGLRMPVGVSAGRSRPSGPNFVVVADHGSDRLVIFRVQEGRLGKRVDVPVGRGPVQAAFGDLDGDGEREVAVACLGSGRVDIVELGPGDPVLSRSISFTEGSSPSDLEVADLDRDGREDLIISDFSKNGVRILLQEEGLLVERPFLGTSGTHPNGLTVTDLEGDGELEILVPNRDSDSIDLFRKEGGAYRLSETFSTSSETGQSFGPVELRVLDLDGDAQMDLVATHMRSGSLKVFRGRADDKTSQVHSASVGKGTPFSSETTRAEPNPSSGDVSFVFSLTGPTAVKIRIFDIAGTLVWTRSLGESETHAGENRVLWKGRNRDENKVASGLYLCLISATGRTVTKKVAIIR